MEKESNPMMPDTFLPALDIEADFLRELAVIEAESIGWYALDDGAYLHIGADQSVILITGQATATMADINMLWIV
jgi:hypothetical protein